jgi:hypothetical protein
VKLKAEQFASICICNHDGSWYVYVDDGSELGRCLHKDGQIREGTIHGGQWLGYYENEIEAAASISNYFANLPEATQ